MMIVMTGDMVYFYIILLRNKEGMYIPLIIKVIKTLLKNDKYVHLILVKVNV